MEIRLLESSKDKNKVSFIVKDTTPAFVNTLRRIMIDDVPTMAIEEVEFRKNSSILYDEIIAHRLGMVPLTTDLKSYDFPEDYDDLENAPAKAKVAMTLKAKGPCTVYASDLKTKDPAIKPAFPKTPIVTLLKGQSLELEAVAVLGTGKMHAKWAPCLAYYKHKPTINVGNVKNPEEVVEGTHGNVFEIKNNKLEVVKDNLFKYDLAGVVEDVSNGTVTVTEDNDFIFYMESWGQLPCKEILSKALDVYNETFDALNDEIKKAT